MRADVSETKRTPGVVEDDEDDEENREMMTTTNEDVVDGRTTTTSEDVVVEKSTSKDVVEERRVANGVATPRDAVVVEKMELEVTESGGRKCFQYLASLSAGLVGMQAGMHLGWTAPVMPYLSSPGSFLPPLSESEISWMTSLMAVGAIFGAVPAGKIADRFGRKTTILANAVPFLASWLTLTFGRDVGSICAARFLGGVGAGAACVLAPMYIGEIAESSIRGALGVLFPLLLSSGIVYSYVLGAYLPYRTFNVVCCAALLPLIVAARFVPESPTWLVHRGRKREAARILARIRSPGYDAGKELATLQEDAERVESRRGGLRDLVRTKSGRKAIATCVGLMFFQQMSGIDAVLFYTVDIFQDAGSTIEPFFATIVIGIIEVVMTIVVALIIDKFGRKPLLVLSGVAMTVCLVVVGYYFKLKADGASVLRIGWLPLTCLALFNVVFSIGYGSVPFAVISELFPPETKGVASSISIVVHWSLVFAVTKLFPTMEALMGQAGAFWTFGCFTAMAAVFSYTLVPETKGKTLQEIQQKLRRRRKDTKAMITEAV